MTRKTTPKMQRLALTLSTLALIAATPASASASQYVLHHPKREHCHAHYVKGYENVQKKGRSVEETICVRVAPKVAAPAPPLQITVNVWDPINTGNEFETPKAGYRFIAVELALTNTGTATISDNANIDTTVVGANSQTYTFALGDERVGCTDFGYGDFTLAPGGKATGCVVYELPEGVKVAKVQFGLNLNVERTFSVEGH